MDVETGTVVGINAAIRAHMEGTSFAIPINRVREIMHDLADGQQIHHGYLGISLSTCTPEWARQNNERTNSDYGRIPEVQGAPVHKVFPRTPAEKGGLRENDVILKVDGKKVESADDARTLIDGASVGKVRCYRSVIACMLYLVFIHNAISLSFIVIGSTTEYPSRFSTHGAGRSACRSSNKTERNTT